MWIFMINLYLYCIANVDDLNCKIVNKVKIAPIEKFLPLKEINNLVTFYEYIYVNNNTKK